MIANFLPDVWVNESLTLYRRSTADTYGSGDAVSGKRGRLNKSDARIAGGLIDAATVVFLLDASTVSSVPRPHDKIVDAGSITYHINFCELVNFNGSFWRCETTRAV